MKGTHDEEENASVPNTGAFTGEGGSAEIANNFPATVAVAGIVETAKRVNGITEVSICDIIYL